MIHNGGIKILGCKRSHSQLSSQKELPFFQAQYLFELFENIVTGFFFATTSLNIAPLRVTRLLIKGEALSSTEKLPQTVILFDRGIIIQFNKDSHHNLWLQIRFKDNVGSFRTIRSEKTQRLKIEPVTF